jgi:hypothetical protein
MLSLPKILLLIVVVLAVVYGTRLLGRARKGGGGDNAAANGGDGAVDMVKCPKCGKFFDPAVGACDCGSRDAA